MRFKILLLTCAFLMVASPLMAEDVQLAPEKVDVLEKAEVPTAAEAPAPIAEEAPVVEPEKDAKPEEEPKDVVDKPIVPTEEAPTPEAKEEPVVEEAKEEPVAEKPKEEAPVIEEAPAEEPKLEEAVIEEAKPEVPTEIKTDAEMGEALGMVIDMAKQGKWMVAIGLLLMILVYAARRFKLLALAPKKAIPWITLGLGLTTSVAMALITEHGWMASLFTGIGGSVGSIGLWELLGKHFLGLPESNDDKAEEPSDSEPS